MTGGVMDAARDGDERGARWAGVCPVLGEARVVVRDAGGLAEGPRWVVRADGTGWLVWVDILAGRVHGWRPGTGERRVVETGRLIGCVVPIEGEDGRVLGAGTEVDGAGGTRSAIGVVRLGDGKDGGWAEIARVDAAEGVRCNDGAVDPAGRLWVGTMSLRDEVGRGELFRLDRVGGGAVVTRVLEGVSISNGIGWSPDGRRMYYVDSPTRRVDVFEFDVVTGGVSGRRTLWEVPEEFGGAVPDGLCVDDAGRVWVALWDGWAVACVDGAGMLLGVVRVPAPRVTSCCFGGQDGGTLYVTTASVGLSGAERVRWPASGCVLSCRPEGLGEGARGSAARRVQV